MSIVLDPSSTALIVVDMQKDFCYEDGALYVGDQVKEIIPKIKSLIESAKAYEVPLIFTKDWHTPDDPEFGVWSPHCIQNTEGVNIIDELYTDGYFVRKRRYSAFFGTDLDLYLRERDIRTLIIVGVVTNICVLHTAGDAASRGYEIVIPGDCVAALSEYDQEYALYHVSSIFQGKITSSGDIVF
ncbi:MAG: isochorismatase family cysteine hydrolase [Halobacteriota archaeon]|nr:isochorismatase family cysteine hydrolase [Halobacteriota archaeon]